MNKISYKKLTLISLITIIIIILMYFGFTFINLFSTNLSRNEYSILILMAIILILSILGFLSGITSFKLAYSDPFVPKTYIIFNIVCTIINLGISIWSLMILILVYQFIRA